MNVCKVNSTHEKNERGLSKKYFDLVYEFKNGGRKKDVFKSCLLDFIPKVIVNPS